MAREDGISGFSLTRIAPAKINLALHVVGQRADGYHLLESLVTFADAGDRIGFPFPMKTGSPSPAAFPPI